MAQQIWIQVVDADYQPIKDARVRARSGGQRDIKLRREDERWVGEVREGEEVLIESRADGFEDDTHRVRIRGRVTQVVHGLRRPGQKSYEQGDNRVAVAPREDAYLVDVAGQDAVKRFTAVAKKLGLEWSAVGRQEEDQPRRPPPSSSTGSGLPWD